MKKYLSFLISFAILITSLCGFSVFAEESLTKNAFEYISAANVDVWPEVGMIYNKQDDPASGFTSNFQDCLDNDYLGYCSYCAVGYNCYFEDIPSYVEIDIRKTANVSNELCLSIDGISYDVGKKIAVFNTDINNSSYNQRVTLRLPVDSACSIEAGSTHTIFLKFQAAGFELYGFRFTGVEGIDLVSTSYSTDVELDPFCGEIEMTFDNTVDESTVEENISFTDEDGNTPDGGIIYSCAKKKVKIAFGELKYNTKYTLRITTGLKSRNGFNIGEVKELVFTTGSEDSNIIDEDFSGDDYVVGAHPPINDNFTYMSSGNQNDISGASVGEINGKKYISIKSGKKNSGSLMKIKLEDIRVDEYFVLTYKVRATSEFGEAGIASRTVGNMLSSSIWNSSIVLNLSDTGKITGFTADAGGHYGELSYNKVDSNGFTEIKLIIKKDPLTGYTMTEAYNPYDSDAKPFVKYSNNIKVSVLDEYGLVNIFPINDEQLGEKIDITDIRAEKKRMPKPVYSQCLMDENEFSLNFNQDIDESTIDKIIVKDATGNAIKCEAKCKNMRDVTLIPDEYIRKSEKYIIDVTGVKNSDGINCPESVEIFVLGAKINTGLKDANGVEITDNDYSKLDVLTVITEANPSVILIVSVLDSDGRIIKTVAGAPQKSNVVVDNLLNSAWSKIKIFAWYESDNYIEPLISLPTTIEK